MANEMVGGSEPAKGLMALIELNGLQRGRRHVTPLPFFLFLYLSQRNMPHACHFAPEFERVTRLPAIAGDNRGHSAGSWDDAQE